MIKFKLYFILLIASIALFSCHKDDAVAPPRDRSQQYSSDIDSIEKYLHNHYIKHVTVNGEPDVEIDSIPAGGSQTSIWDNTEFPLQFKIVKNDVRKTYSVDGKSDDAVEYKMYYLVINQGGGQKPTTIDSTFTSYKGWTLNDNVFDARDTPLWSTYPANPKINEIALISGYRQFLPELKTATASAIGEDGSVTFTNSGVGIVFIPSGLGYFDVAKPFIGPYSPLVFKIMLQSLRYRDHDRDGILAKDEIYNGETDYFNQDTDKDNIPDFLDIDDDGDGYSTLFEIQENGVKVFPYPTCDSGIPKYLDKTCHPAKKQ